MRKKILLIIPELIMGGAQRSLSKLSMELSKQHQVWIVLFNQDQIAYRFGGELLSLDVKTGPGLFQKINAFIRRISRLKKIKKELGIEVAISFLEGADYINVLSRSGEKIILSIRGSKHHDETMIGKFFWLRNRILIPWLYRKADVIVTVNRGIVKELSHYGLQNSACVTIGNFYDLKEIDRLAVEPKDENLKLFYQDPVLITTGRLATEKGLDHLIEIFYELKKKNKRRRLILVGDGPLRTQLISLCKKFNLIVNEGNDFKELPDVLFAGSQSNVFKYLHGATVYLMNSSSEGFPNGLAEAMICKVPVISSDCPYGPREILTPDFEYSTPVTQPYISQFGILMPMIKSVEDKKIWIETVNEILGKAEVLSQLATKGRERVSEFDQELMLSKWQTILNG